MERGVRYLDIRYGFTGGDRKHSDITNASSRLKLVHGGFTAEHKTYDNALGIASHEKTNNEKLMSWLKTFLTENPSETVILDISTDDEKENNPKAATGLSKTATPRATAARKPSDLP